MNSLGAKSLSAVFWGTGGAMVRLLLQFGAQVILARLLGPEQYGLFAIGAIVISFSNFFSDIGLAYGLIQKPSVTGRDIRFVFTWQIILGLAVSTAIALSSGKIASFFGDDRAAGIVQVLAIICLLNALAAPSMNLLKRDLDFRRIQLFQISSFILGYITVGIPLALLGSQVWALVAAWVTQALVMLLLLYRATRHPLQPLIHYEDAKALSGYGAIVLITNLINWLINNIDRVIIGRFFDNREIGLYATTYNMLLTPTTSLLGIVQPVFFSASARLSGDKAVIASSYRALIAAVAVFLLPAFVAVSAVSETFVLAVYGPKWIEATHLFAPLALAMPLYLIWGFTTPLLWTGGHASREFKVQLPLAIVWASACWLAAQHSVVAVAWTVLALFLARCLLIIGTAAHYLALEKCALWRAVRGGIVCSLLIGFVVTSIDRLVGPLPAITKLMIDALVGACALLLALRLLPFVIPPELATLNGRILGKMPPAIAARFAFLGKLGAV
jgi:lipopolysaccharide exporter